MERKVPGPLAQDEFGNFTDPETYENNVHLLYAEPGDINYTLNFMEAAGARTGHCQETLTQLSLQNQRLGRMLHDSLHDCRNQHQQLMAQRELRDSYETEDLHTLQECTELFATVSNIPLELAEAPQKGFAVAALRDQYSKTKTGRMLPSKRSREHKPVAELASKKRFDTEELMDTSLQTTAELLLQLEFYYNAMNLCQLIDLPDYLRRDYSVKKTLRRAVKAYGEPVQLPGGEVSELIQNRRRPHQPARNTIAALVNDESFARHEPDTYARVATFAKLDQQWTERMFTYIEKADALFGEAPAESTSHSVGKTAVAAAETTETEQPPPASLENQTTSTPESHPEQNASSDKLGPYYAELFQEADRISAEYTQLVENWQVTSKTLRNYGFNPLTHSMVTGETLDEVPDVDGIPKEEAQKVAGILCSLMFREQHQAMAADIRAELQRLQNMENQLQQCYSELQTAAHQLKESVPTKPATMLGEDLQWIHDNWSGLEVMMQTFAARTGFPLKFARDVFAPSE
ncbi:hypothetical protein BRC19_02850 [Candidatus Saccharibacteria bacterium QS_5_54_17]|nr:MAG: hypothetical protein BRC19_02850 [Candidatus Saccharibacteria bacterium QS_5_54_17]